MSRSSRFGLLCCLAALSAARERAVPAPPYQASSDRVVRKPFALAGRGFVQTTRHKAYPLDPRVPRATPGMNGQPPDEEVSVVAIARPRTAGEKRWNAVVAAHAARLLRDLYGGDKPNPLFPMNVVIAVELAAAGPDFLAVSWQSYAWWYNQAWGSTSTGELLWSLAEDRPITTEDIFRPDSGWTTALALPLTRRLLEPEPVDRPMKGSTALQRAQSPAIVPEGLWLRFKEGENERWWQGQPGCLRWTRLKPFLRGKLPFDLSALRWRNPAAATCGGEGSVGRPGSG